MWNVNGLTDGIDFECPLTMGPITNPDMIQDGGLYQMGFIKRWLDEHNTSPLTNVPLEHLRIFRMASLAQVVDVFLSR